MSEKHTPGPWRWVEEGDANTYCLLASGDRWVISFRQNGEILTGKQRANADLIAAAPKLLEVAHLAERIINGLLTDDQLDFPMPWLDGKTLREYGGIVEQTIAEAGGDIP